MCKCVGDRCEHGDTKQWVREWVREKVSEREWEWLRERERERERKREWLRERTTCHRPQHFTLQYTLPTAEQSIICLYLNIILTHVNYFHFFSFYLHNTTPYLNNLSAWHRQDRYIRITRIPSSEAKHGSGTLPHPLPISSLSAIIATCLCISLQLQHSAHTVPSLLSPLSSFLLLILPSSSPPLILTVCVCLPVCVCA